MFFDLRKIKSGQNYTLFLAKDSLRTPEFFIYESNALEYVVIDFKESADIYIGKKDVVKKEGTAKAVITSSLWNAFSAAGVNPNLAITLSQIYAWSIDFYGIAKGDSVLVIYEESYVEDKPLGDYEIKGAIFNTRVETTSLFLSSKMASLPSLMKTGIVYKKSFLKAP